MSGLAALSTFRGPPEENDVICWYVVFVTVAAVVETAVGRRDQGVTVIRRGRAEHALDPEERDRDVERARPCPGST